MKTIKCKNCGKSKPKESMSIECATCYLLGFDKEREKIRKMIEEDFKNDMSKATMRELLGRLTGGKGK